MMYQGHQAPYLQTLTGFLHHSPLPALPSSHLPLSNVHQHHLQINTACGDGNDSDGVSASASAVLLFESRQTNRELRLQLTDAVLKLDRLLIKVDEIGAERSSDIVLRGSSLSANASGFEPGPLRSSYFQLTRKNEELKSMLSEMTVKHQSQQENISRLLENNHKLLEQNVELMGRSFSSSSESHSKHEMNLEANLAMNPLSVGSSEELNSLKVELASMRTRETECQRQIEKLIRLDQENKQQLQKTDIQLTDYSQTTERLNAELNEEKRRRREAEMTSRALETDAEEMKTKNAAIQKALSDLKSRSKLKITELENDFKSLQDNHQKELALAKERFRKDKSRVLEEHSELMRQTEENLNSSWKRKYANLEKTFRDRYSSEVDELSAEKAFLVDRVSSLEQKVIELKTQGAAEESNRAALLSEVEEYKTWKSKYDSLRTQAISMKDRYAQQTNGLMEEIGLLEEKYNRMTEKYYKAEELLNIAMQKYEEFKVRSLEGQRHLEFRVHQLEAELDSIKSELDEALRRGVQTQLDLDEAKDEYLRLAESAEALKKELEQEKSHVTLATVEPLARTDCIEKERDVLLHFLPPTNTEKALLTSPGDPTNTLKSEPKIEKQEHEQEHEEQRGEQEKRQEVKEREEDDDGDDDEDDDGASFVTALDDGDFIGYIDESFVSDEGTTRDDLENDLPVQSHLDLGSDSRATLSNNLDITCIFLQRNEQDFRNALDLNDLEGENELNQTIDLEIGHGSNLANDRNTSNGLDLNKANDLQETEVIQVTEANETDLTLPEKTTLTPCDLYSRTSYESTSENLHCSKNSDLRVNDDLEEATELDLSVDLDINATVAIPTAHPLSPSSKLEPTLHEDHEFIGTPITNQKRYFIHEGNSSKVQERVNAGDDEFQQQTTVDDESANSPAIKDESCEHDILVQSHEQKDKGWKAGKLESESELKLESESELKLESESELSEAAPSSVSVTKYGKEVEASSDLENLNSQNPPEHSDERKDTVTFRLEDSPYTVTSGGRIVPEWIEGSEGKVKTREGWLTDRDGGQGAEEIQTQKHRGTESPNWSQSPSSTTDLSDFNDVTRSPLARQDQTKSYDMKESNETLNGSVEDPVYTVTSGGQIVPGWTGSTDLTQDGVSHVLPEVDLQHPVGLTTALDVADESLEESSSSDTLEPCSSRSEGDHGISEVPETRSGFLRPKPDDPMSRVGACVILREEDIERMMKRRNGSSSEKEQK